MSIVYVEGRVRCYVVLPQGRGAALGVTLENPSLVFTLFQRTPEPMRMSLARWGVG